MSNKVWISKSIAQGKLVWKDQDGKPVEPQRKPVSPAPKPLAPNNRRRYGPQVLIPTQGSWHTSIAARIGELGGCVLEPDGLAEMRRMIEVATHVLLPGGADIHPHYYGAPVERGCGPFSHRRDLMESWATDYCLKVGKPLFGICRGHQMISIMAGGDLFQDFPSALGVNHDVRHEVAVAKRSPIRDILGPVASVNSFHHQATRNLPAGWKVGAYGPGKVIESIYHPNLPVLSVQWHPEGMDSPEAIAMFKLWLSWKEVRA